MGVESINGAAVAANAAAVGSSTNGFNDQLAYMKNMNDTMLAIQAVVSAETMRTNVTQNAYKAPAETARNIR